MVWRSRSKKRQCIRWSSSTNRFKTMNRRKRNVSNNFCALSSVYFLPLRVSWNARLTLCFYLILLWTWLIHIYPFYLASDQIFWINMKLFSHSSSTVSTALDQIQDKYLAFAVIIQIQNCTHKKVSWIYKTFPVWCLLCALWKTSNTTWWISSVKEGCGGDVCEKTPEQIKALKTCCAGNQHNS